MTDPIIVPIQIGVIPSFSEQHDALKGYNLDVNSYIIKPVNLDRFTDAVEKVGLHRLPLNQQPKQDD